MTAKRSHQPHVARLYRTGTLAFVGVAVLVAGVIGAIALSGTTVAITVGTRDITQRATLTVVEQSPADDELTGTFVFAEMEGGKTVEAPQTGEQVDDYARGTVIIVNRWTKAQPLAAGTRLKASSNGLIYRTAARVDVPAGGEFGIEVVADEAGARGNIGPDRFEIVALWSGLKDQIYGRSSTAMSGGVRSATKLSQATIDNAKRALEDELLAAAADQLPAPADAQVRAGEPFAVSAAVSSRQQAGDSAASVTVEGSVRAAAIDLPAETLNQHVEQLLSNVRASDESFIDNDPTVTWRLTEFSGRNRRAQFDLTVTQRARLQANSQRLQANQFTRRTRQEILTSLQGIPGVVKVEVTIRPFWATRTPGLPSQIKVTVTAAQ
ncbi:MAG: hypothetical protein HY421_00875 [Candidatus Kerfeldbacteria bacterium]|nr:hypothetical protein [Candidatus Kerfeldbacteria bacterium]